MAEEKTTKSATKSTTKSITKSTTKKTAEPKTEEKVEKKFCTNCGKELKAGETCTCTSTTENPSTDPMAAFGASFVATFKKMFTNPTETLKEETDKANLTNGIINLLIVTLSFGIFMMCFFKSLFVFVSHLMTRMAGVFAGASEEIVSLSDMMEAAGDLSLPYFTQFLWAILIYVIFAVVAILITVGIAKFFKNNTFDFKKAVNLYAVSMLPSIAAFLVMAVLGLIGNAVISIIALFAGLIVIIACVVNYITVFMEYLDVQKEKRVYAITALIAIFVIVLSIFTGMFGDKISEGIIEEIESSESSSDFSF